MKTEVTFQIRMLFLGQYVKPGQNLNPMRNLYGEMFRLYCNECFLNVTSSLKNKKRERAVLCIVGTNIAAYLNTRKNNLKN